MFSFDSGISIHLNNKFIVNSTKLDVNTAEAQQLALESAQEGIVLLKNLNNALPLNIDQLKNKRIASDRSDSQCYCADAKQLSRDSTLSCGSNYWLQIGHTRFDRYLNLSIIVIIIFLCRETRSM